MLSRKAKRKVPYMSNNSTTLKIFADKKLHEQLVEKLQARLKNLPEGSLCLKTIRGKACFYHYTYSADNHLKETQTYLSKKDDALKEKLQQKAFIKKALVQLMCNLAAEEEFLSAYHPFNPLDIIEILPESCKTFDLAASLNCVDLRDSNSADKLPLPAKNDKPLYAEGLVHCTSKGLKVRSKSESIIATLLDMNEIEYRYEAPLTLGDHTFYPDFTIMRPSDHKLFYWEHFGMMSSPNYHEQAHKKLQAYILHDFMPWDRLIATFESNKDSFDAQQIDKIIKILLA